MEMKPIVLEASFPNPVFTPDFYICGDTHHVRRWCALGTDKKESVSL